ncbi:DUF572-domain-containing protein [Pisolithus albus]|nr:DUF572-domain-containing protein [Pisolithus albus]
MPTGVMPGVLPLRPFVIHAHTGKHALGDRARKLDKGILITRFELPGTCNNHIGMGVRYNAEKKKVGMYYSTPIYSFRCKCHLCDGWFEIQTDPKNTRYVVVSGARQKDEEWNPEENGGFAIHVTALEKSTDATNILRTYKYPDWSRSKICQITITTIPTHARPSCVNTSARRRRWKPRKRADDDRIKGRYGLPETLKLVEYSDEARNEAREEWERGRRRLEEQSSIRKARLSSSAGPNPAASLRERVLGNMYNSKLVEKRVRKLGVR